MWMVLIASLTVSVSSSLRVRNGGLWGSSICGAGAISVLMAIGDELGWNNTTQLDYATSGDITGDRSSVVGYASIFFTRRAND